MKAAEANAAQLQRHISGTYHTLRAGMGAIAVLLPIVLWAGDRILGHEPLRCSMSAYYYSPVMRDWFVGALVATGALLYLYRGFSRVENVVLNIAGICAVAIAVVPTSPDCGGTPSVTAHGAFAVAFFLCIAYVSVCHASDTLSLSLIKNAKTLARYRAIYPLLGIGMLVSPLVAVALTFVLQSPGTAVFFVEAVAVWAFAAYWITKSVEMRTSDAELKALRQKLQAVSAPRLVKPTPGRIVQIVAD